MPKYAKFAEKLSVICENIGWYTLVKSHFSVIDAVIDVLEVQVSIIFRQIGLIIETNIGLLAFRLETSLGHSFEFFAKCKSTTTTASTNFKWNCFTHSTYWISSNSNSFRRTQIQQPHKFTNDTTSKCFITITSYSATTAATATTQSTLDPNASFRAFATSRATPWCTSVWSKYSNVSNVEVYVVVVKTSSLILRIWFRNFMMLRNVRHSRLF